MMEVGSEARQRIMQAHRETEFAAMLLEIRKHVVEETVSMNHAFDYEGLDEEVTQALLDLAAHGERHREHLTRYARSRAGRFVYVRASGWR